ncbi:MAG: caspase family protein [Proteobacteria bacterium]|nr:caspase family protein [Pseudomonadota bacterium]
MLPENVVKLETHWVQAWVCLLLLLGLSACTPTRPPQAQARPLPPMAKSQTGAESSAATPFLRIETGMHTAPIRRIAVDQQERYLVTASHDKTARVWDLRTGRLLQILRPPIGEGDEGKLYAVAISPDGTTVAVGGWTSPSDAKENIYFFDRASGHLTRRISGLPNVIKHLAYSQDGLQLAAALGGGNGIRAYRTDDLREVFKDADYGDDSYSVEFDRQGRLVSTSRDGYLRLYDKSFHLLAKQKAPGGNEPYSACFSPDGSKIAVGFNDTTAVNVLAGDTLELLYAPDTHGVSNGSLNTVAWSQDGQWLYAGGMYIDGSGYNAISRWAKAGRGDYSEGPAANNTIFHIHALSQNRLVFGTGYPMWGVLDATGRTLMVDTSFIVDHRHIRNNNLLLAVRGDVVEFQFPQNGRILPTYFDVSQRRWQLDESSTTQLSPPRTTASGLNITDWEYNIKPQLNGQTLKLEPSEMSRSLAIAPDGKRFLLGTEWYLNLFDRQGKLLGSAPTPGTTYAVNISGDGRWAVAAFGDGTIRWYGLEDGQERLAFFPHADGKRWVLWTPEGFFDASPGAEELIGYHINQGPDKEGQFVEVKQLYSLFYRPDLVAKRFQGDEQPIREALAKIGDVRQVLAGGLPPALELLSKPEVTQTEPDYTLQFKVNDLGGGIGKLIYRINGKLIEGRPIGIGIPGHAPLNTRFPLAPGENIIEVSATNDKGQIESRSIRAVVNLQQPQRQASMYVLALGISQYRDHAMELKFADKDADALTTELKQNGAGLFKSVQVKMLLNQQATLANIQAAFAELSGKVQPQDVFVLYLAGHAKTLNGSYHFAPWEMIYENGAALHTNSLDQDKLNELLVKIQAQKSVILLDTCESGSFKLASRGLEQKTAIDQLMHATGSAVLAATQDDKMALEGYQQHGVFTFALLEGMKKADSNNNQQIEIDELASYVAELVPRITKQQWGYEQFPMRELHKMSFPIGMKP